MKKKALLIILLSFSVLIIPPNSIMTFSPLDKSPEKTLTNEPKETIQINKYPDFPIPTNSIQKNTAESFLCQPNGLITPTYTEVSSSSKSILPENSSLNMTSHTTTSSQNVYTGTVDFLDLKINTLTNGSTVENYYSNRFAIHFSLTKTIISKGFLIGITPTIRETLLFSIREELNGPPILNGSLNEYIGNSAHDLLYPLPIIFDYTACSASELQLIKDNDYYLTL
ncbi:MAG: hypothetical protein U9O98_06925, partial [Asgard group archaeon]|nr:hypothetical protein [Asgard group archaeon]